MAWNDQSGGFESSPSVNASPSVKETGSQEKNGLKPVCIKYIHRAFVDDQFTAIDGTQLQQVVVLGTILTAETNNQRYDYRLADGSGATVLAREYINDEDTIQPELLGEGTYVTVYGTLKSFQGNPHLIINKIDRVKNPNEITTQLLEMTYSYLRMKMGAGGGAAVDKSADAVEQVRTVIQGNKSMTGLSSAEIKSALPHLASEKIAEAISFLSGDGFIFSTIDDDHYRCTEES